MSIDAVLRVLECVRKDLEDLKREYDALHSEVVDANSAINDFHAPLYGDSTPQKIRSLVQRCHDHESREARLELMLIAATSDMVWGRIDLLDLSMSEFCNAYDTIGRGEEFDFSKFLPDSPET